MGRVPPVERSSRLVLGLIPRIVVPDLGVVKSSCMPGQCVLVRCGNPR